MNKPRLYTHYTKTIAPELKKTLGLDNLLQVPKITKVVINVGYGKHVKDPAFVENVEKTLAAISGQKPVHTKAKKSISNFKIRQGMAVGAMVTLRGARMYDFVDKLTTVTFPRVRDFHGISPAGFDKEGNYTIGLKEHIAFPEVGTDSMDKIHGLQITISTTANSIAQGRALLSALGFPFLEK